MHNSGQNTVTLVSLEMERRMCPVCLATAAILAGSATGGGVLTAFVAGKILKRKKRKDFPNQKEAEEVDRGNQSNRNQESEDGVTR